MRGHGSPWEGENRTDFTSGLEAGGMGIGRIKCGRDGGREFRQRRLELEGIWTTMWKSSAVKTPRELKGGLWRRLLAMEDMQPEPNISVSSQDFQWWDWITKAV